MSEFLRRGWEVRSSPVIPSDWTGDVVVLDRPPHEVPDLIEDPRLKGSFKVVMGVDHPSADFVWYPLGPGRAQRELLILDPRISGIVGWGNEYDLYVYFGVNHRLYGWEFDWPADWKIFVPEGLVPEECWQAMADSKRALLGWGQSCFEAMALGVSHIVVVNDRVQYEEARRLNVPLVTVNRAWSLTRSEWVGALKIIRPSPRLDVGGAARVVDAIEAAYRRRTCELSFLR